MQLDSSCNGLSCSTPGKRRRRSGRYASRPDHRGTCLGHAWLLSEKLRPKAHTRAARPAQRGACAREMADGLHQGGPAGVGHLDQVGPLSVRGVHYSHQIVLPQLDWRPIQVELVGLRVCRTGWPGCSSPTLTSKFGGYMVWSTAETVTGALGTAGPGGARRSFDSSRHSWMGSDAGPSFLGGDPLPAGVGADRVTFGVYTPVLQGRWMSPVVLVPCC